MAFPRLNSAMTFGKMALAASLVAGLAGPAMACSTSQLAGMWHFSTALTECYPVNIAANGIGRGTCITYDAPGSEGFIGTWEMTIRAKVLRDCSIEASFIRGNGARVLLMTGHLQAAPGAFTWTVGTLEHYGPFYLSNQP